MTDLDAKQSSRWVDPMFTVASLILVVVGGFKVLSLADPTSRVLGVLTMMCGAAAAMLGGLNMRGRLPVANLHAEQSARRSALTSIGIGLLAVGGTLQSLVDPSRVGRVLGIFVMSFGVLAIVVGGRTLWHYRRRKT